MWRAGRAWYVTVVLQCVCVGSGGVDRDWVGVPRLLFSPGSSRSRCVCVEKPSATGNPNLQEYQDCPPEAESCPAGD